MLRLSTAPPWVLLHPLNPKFLYLLPRNHVHDRKISLMWRLKELFYLYSITLMRICRRWIRISATVRKRWWWRECGRRFYWLLKGCWYPRWVKCIVRWNRWVIRRWISFSNGWRCLLFFLVLVVQKYWNGCLYCSSFKITFMPTGKVQYHWKFYGIKNTEMSFRYGCIMIGTRCVFFFYVIYIFLTFCIFFFFI